MTFTSHKLSKHAALLLTNYLSILLFVTKLTNNETNAFKLAEPNFTLLFDSMMVSTQLLSQSIQYVHPMKK
jgi:hypothetical protein